MLKILSVKENIEHVTAETQSSKALTAVNFQSTTSMTIPKTKFGASSASRMFIYFSINDLCRFYYYNTTNVKMRFSIILGFCIQIFRTHFFELYFCKNVTY